MSKTQTPDTTRAAETAAPALSTRSSTPPRREIVEPEFTSPQAERAWHAEQQRLEEKRREAWSKYPPGSTMFVTTARGIPRRGRAGIVFSDKARTTVKVLGDEAEVAAKVKAGGDFVTPEGAAAIAEDDGLQMFGDRGPDSSVVDEKDRRIAELEAEGAALRAKVAKASRAGGEGGPERLAPGKAGDFGGDDKPKG